MGGASNIVVRPFVAEENVSEDGLGLQRCLENLQTLQNQNVCMFHVPNKPIDMQVNEEYFEQNSQRTTMGVM